MTLRSGTNSLRGSTIGLYRGTALDSNQIQNIRNNISNEGHTYYNNETMVSGPIRRSKTFFMGGYQGFYENIPFPVTRTVPTALQLQGDFSQTTTANGTPIVIYDPATTRSNGAGGFIRDQIQCNGRLNVICQDRFHPVARTLLQYFPRPNAAPSNLAGNDNFVNSPSVGRYRYNSYLTRIDHNFNTRHRLSFTNTGNWGIEYRNENGLPEPAIRSDNWPTHRNHYLASVDDNVTLNSSTLWNTRLSFDRFEEPHDKVYGNIDPQLPFQGPFQLTGPPFVQISGVASETMFPRTAYRRDNNALSLNSSISRTMGRHFTKMGGEVRAYDFYRSDEFTTNGTFGFNSTFTRRDPLSATGATSGSAMASFLLGLPNSGSVQSGIPRTERYRYYALYVQDDWKLGARATLNVGLRWDYQPPVTVKDNLTVSAFDETSVNPLQAQLPAGAINPATGQPLQLKGGLVFANHGGPDSPYESDWNNIQPRVGFTYKVNDWLIARSNYGRSYLGLSSGGQNGVYFTDFSRTTPFLATAPDNVSPGTPWSTPFPDGFLEPRAGELGLATNIGAGFTIPNRDYEIPYTDQWMAGVDIQLPWNIGLDLAYVGNKVSKLGAEPAHQRGAEVGERQAHPEPRRHGELPERDVPEPVRRAGAGTDAERGHGLAGRPASAVPAVHRHHQEPAQPRVGVLQRARGGGDQALHERRDVRGQLHVDEARGSGQLPHQLRHRAVQGPPGRSAEAPAGHHDPRRSALRTGEADWPEHDRPRQPPDRRLAVQHDRRDSVRQAARAERQLRPS